MRTLSTNNNADIAGGAAMMGVVIATLIAIVCGVLVWYKLNLSIFTAGTLAAPTAASTAAYNASRATQMATWGSVNATANTVWTLFPIVCIVVIASVVLAIVMGFGRGSA